MSNKSRARESPHTHLLTLGRQTCDGLGRQLSVEVGGRITRFEYKSGQLSPCANRLPDGKRVAFSYLAALNDVVASIEPDGEPANVCTYHPVLGTPAIKSGPLGELAFKYSPSGKPQEDNWTVGNDVYTSHWRHSLNGRLLELTDSSGEAHGYQHDDFGRIKKYVQGEVTTTFTYDTFSRLETLTTTDGKRELAQTLAYDFQGREHTRTFVVTLGAKPRTCIQTLLYSDLDQLVSRHWEDGDRGGEETFEYDALGRLTHYTADPSVAPRDPFGNVILGQRFAFNLLDGYTHVVSTFDDGSADTAIFHYENPLDPTQVSRVTHDHESWPGEIVLNYDACGRVSSDSLGRHLTWDAQDRLTRVEYRGQSCDYRYDPAGSLCDRVLDGTLSRSFFSADLLTHEQTGDQVVQRIGSGRALFALNRITNSLREVTLLGCDAQGSVRLEADSAVRVRHYSAHGAEPEQSANGLYGYTGERREPLTDWYIPGGNRPYDPVIMGFLSPDSESPFGRGGLNAYAYCSGDPVNRIDPDGHAWWKWVVAGIGTALGVIGTVATLGAAAPAFAAFFAGGVAALTASGAVAMTAATLSVVSLGTGVASTVLEAVGKDSKAASILGWVSLGTGLLGTALEIAPKAASSLASMGRAIGRGGQKAGRAAKMAPGAYASNTKAGTPITPHKTSTPVVLHSIGGAEDVVYHPNYLGSGFSAFETHGSSSGLLMDSTGKMVSPERVALEIQDWLGANGRPDGEPFTLLACWAAKSGAAQKVSDMTGRPVTAFLNEIHVAPPRYALRLSIDAVPRVEKPQSWWAYLAGQRAEHAPAPSRIFLPSSRIV